MNYSDTYYSDLCMAQNMVPNISKLFNSRILITGANGLVCSALADFLMYLNDTKDAKIKIYLAVRAIEKAKKRFGDRLLKKDINLIQYDALNSLDWNFPLDYVVHGASPANPVVYVKHPVETMLTNFNGLNNILDYAVKNHVGKVLFVSSSEVYGNKDGIIQYNEDDFGYVNILSSRACYPSAKRACETLCTAYKDEYNVRSCIVRLGHVYGPTATRDDTRASSQFFYDVIDGHNIVMKSAGLQVRSYCYVIDCISALLSVLINGEECVAYNISNSKSVASIRELAEMIAKCSGKKVVYEDPTDVEVKGYNPMLNSSLTSERIEQLGWKGQFDLEKGVNHTIRILKGE